MCGGSAPAPVIQAPAPTPKPTYTADDGTVFDDMSQYNSYQNNIKRNKFTTGLQSAYNKAQQDSMDYLSGKGVNAANYQGDILSSLDKLKLGIPDLAANPESYFRNVGEDIYNRETTANRTNYQNAFNSRYGTNFADQLFGNAADDAVLDAIYAEKYAPASGFLSNALTRGQLSTAGYDYAMKNLNNQATAARSKLQSLGGDVLSGYRTGLNNLRDQANSAINNYQLGQTFNIDDWTSQLANQADQYKGSLEGDIRAATGDVALFDPQSLLTQAAAFGGASNAQGDLTAAIMESQKKKTDQRGVGTSGVF